MNDKKNSCLKVLIDTTTEMAFKRIVELKGLTIQGTLENLLKSFIVENLDCIMNDNARK